MNDTERNFLYDQRDKRDIPKMLKKALSQDEIKDAWRRQAKKKGTPTNSTTRAIIDYLNLKGIKAWRNNNNAVWDEKRGIYRKNHSTLLGVPDIIGVDKFGKAVFIEVKTGKDAISPQQHDFLQEMNKRRCLAFVAHTSKEAEKIIDNYLQ